MTTEPRRTFLGRLTGVIVAIGGVVASWPLLRSLSPNVLYESPKKFKVGTPDEFQQGVTFIDEHRIYLFREGANFHVVSAVCSHLGCTVKFAPFKQKQEMTVRKYSFEAFGEFRCPCHGSKFHGEGTNYAGPAPRPLKAHPVQLSSANGQLVVDLGQEVDRDFRLVV